MNKIMLATLDGGEQVVLKGPDLDETAATARAAGWQVASYYRLDPQEVAALQNLANGVATITDRNVIEGRLLDRLAL